MHTTVRGGKSTLRWAFDQGGGYQGMPVNEDPRGTNVMPRDQEPPPELGPQRAAELRQGTMADLQKLRESMVGEQLDLLDSILSAIMPPGSYEALSGEGGPVGRPTPPVVDTGEPPPFQGRPRAGGGQDAYRTTMRPPAAMDKRPRGTGPNGLIMAHDTAAIEDLLRRNRARENARVTASIEKRFPGALSRLKRVV
jgi:hypothetical protein